MWVDVTVHYWLEWAVASMYAESYRSLSRSLGPNSQMQAKLALVACPIRP